MTYMTHVTYLTYSIPIKLDSLGMGLIIHIKNNVCTCKDSD